ncbi:ATP-binding protein [Maribellus luteus]|uniref:ATP-binding protein n=1 Tax=Maribellus luteus TaxID=2305463 RepID=A0A399T7B2_9BACT|nr:ATP-binding protein [Maribellus luteus]RIJ49793.1 ATP-binding protein [Maribellus luteus]
MIKRDLQDLLQTDTQPGKAVLLFGARRVGKTILLESLIKQLNKKTAFLNGEDFSTEEMLSTRTVNHYRQLFQGTEILVIDEAQNIKDIGRIIKLIVDNLKELSVIISGSSSFDLYNQAGEPLVGRSYQYKLFPFSLNELTQTETRVGLIQKLEELLVYGMYPELQSIPDYGKKQQYLLEIANSYLLKDILMIDGIKNSGKMRDLLRLIAYQTGSEVSYDELAKKIGLSRNTVEKYLDLLSKTFVIYKLPAFARNPRKEVSKSSKWYFFDNGIRNAVINDFRPVAIRKDTGALWESFLISERIKKQNNANCFASYYFWRSYTKQEIDLLEESNGVIKAYEFKWGERKVKTPTAFNENYPEITFEVINKSNFLDFLL